jgi:HEAT repeat protein
VKRLQRRMGYSWPVREKFAAACAYVQRVDADAIEKLLNETQSAAVRFAAARELVRRQERRAVPSLIRALWRKQPQAILWALGELADDRALPVVSVLLEWDFESGSGVLHSSYNALVRAVARFGEKALPVIERELRTGWPERAVAILELMDTPASHAMLEEEYERQQASGHACRDLKRALGIVSPPWHEKNRQRQIGFTVYKDTNAPIPDDPVPALLAVLEARDWRRRRLAVDALAMFDSSIVAAPIARLASDTEWEVRASVACALRRWDTEEAVLRTLATDTNPAVRWLAKNPLYESGVP